MKLLLQATHPLLPSCTPRHRRIIAITPVDNSLCGYTPRMTAPPEHDARGPSTVEPDYGVSAAPLVYVTVGLGLAVSLTILLIARGSFGVGTTALALLLVAPFLLYARLAVARPGPEAVLGGVLLLAVSIWGSISAMDSESAAPFIRLPIELMVLEVVIFAAGAMLRAVVPTRRRDVPER